MTLPRTPVGSRTISSRPSIPDGLLLPVVCVYYPLSTLPGWLQPIALALPPTYVFEGMRALLLDHAYRADLMLRALALNAIYFTLACAAFSRLFAAARRTGALLQIGE